jgi:hypothetical protein
VTDINRPDVVAEVTAAFERYERAFCENDLAVLDELFWEDDRVVRFGPTETLYGVDAVRRFRRGRPSDDLARTLLRTTITTFGETTATTSIEFRRHRSGRRGRQSQTWIRTVDGWRVVAAHVSAVEGSAATEIHCAAPVSTGHGGA